MPYGQGWTVVPEFVGIPVPVQQIPTFEPGPDSKPRDSRDWDKNLRTVIAIISERKLIILDFIQRM